MSEVAAETASGIFVIGFAATDGERHVGVDAGDAEFVEQADEIGVGAIIVNDEPGIDGQGTAAGFDGHGMRVAAQAMLSFEEENAMLAA